MPQVSTSVPAGRISVDHAKLQRMLGSPELSWLVDRIRGRLERGEPIDGTVTLVGATPAQRRAAARLLGHGTGRGSTLSVPLPAVALELYRAAAAPNLQAAVEAIGGPVRDLAAERAADLRRWGDALASVRACRLAGLSWFQDWLDSIRRDGTVTKLIRQGHGDLLGQAAEVLERLPDGPEPSSAVLSTLSAEVTGDERALTDGPLGTLVLRALAVREGVPQPTGPSAREALWGAAGVVTDDLASQVLVLNVRASGELLGGWLAEAADAGVPFRVTLRQLIATPVLPLALDVHVCSSSALVRAAADELGSRCPALVCTEGEPSVACTALLHAAVSSGSTVYWHGDFSWRGLRGTASAIRRLRARPWQMSAADYQAALAAGSEPLTGTAEPSPWDPRLAELMKRAGRLVGEERLLPGLIADLTERQSLG
jgi:uncharacterized protein (TIGR02679 family)